MAGHSKWANIKHKKARQDAARGKLFAKLSKEIFVAVREGGPDPDTNTRLRLALSKAKDNNMPNDNIERAIKKGSGDMDGVNYEQVTYEGYGPEGVAVMVDVLTDNRNRTAADIRHIFSKNGGNLGETGCVSFMFDRKGYLVIDREQTDMDEDDLMLLAIEAGAEDVSADETSYEIKTEPEDFEEVRRKLTEEGLRFTSAEVTMIPQNTVSVSEENAEKVLKLMNALEDNDDVQNVYANFDIEDGVMEKLNA